MVRPVVGGLSKAFEAGGAKPFDQAETEGGLLALSAAFYEYGDQLRAWHLCVMWLGGVAIPRVPDLVKTFKQDELAAPPPAPKPLPKPQEAA
jgi:hypothetical protein